MRRGFMKQVEELWNRVSFEHNGSWRSAVIRLLNGDEPPGWNVSDPGKGADPGNGMPRKGARGALNIPGYRPADLFSGNCPAAGQQRRIYAGQKSGDPRIGRHRSDHGAPHDTGGRK